MRAHGQKQAPSRVLLLGNADDVHILGLKGLQSPAPSILSHRYAVKEKGVCDYVGFNTGNGEKLSYSQAEPGQVRQDYLIQCVNI